MSDALVLDGTSHELWLARARNGYVLHADGAQAAVALRPLAEHIHELVVGDDLRRVHVAVRGDMIHVHLDGETYTLRHVQALERFAGSAADNAESVARAPMPGSVIAVHVAAGQPVQRGDLMVVIESMKMETAIAAGQDGVVQAVHVAVGQTFERDAALVTLEQKA